MRLLIESTDTVCLINGVPARLWQGVSEGGAHCKVFVASLALEDGQDPREFDAELRPTGAPAEAITPLWRVAPASRTETPPSVN